MIEETYMSSFETVSTTRYTEKGTSTKTTRSYHISRKDNGKTVFSSYQHPSLKRVAMNTIDEAVWIDLDAFKVFVKELQVFADTLESENPTE